MKLHLEIDIPEFALDAFLSMGCCDHSCQFNKPKGMGTNGGKCYCLDNLNSSQRRAAERILHAAFIALDKETE